MQAMPRIAFALLLTGCSSYGATNTPVTEQNAVEAPALVGRWMNVSEVLSDSAGTDSTCLVVRSPAAREYQAELDKCDARGPARLNVGLAVFGGELFAATQANLADTTVALGEDVLALYSFYRLRFQQDSLFVAMLDADALQSLLFESPDILEHALLEGNGPDVLLTATPERLAWFLATYARDSTLWEISAPLGWARVP